MSKRGCRAVPTSTSLTVCAPELDHDRAATTIRGTELDRYRLIVETYAPSTYSLALPRVGPFGAISATARPVNRNVTDAPRRVA